MKTISFIMTFNDLPQRFEETNINNNELENPENLFDALSKELSEDEKQNLCKISCCVDSKDGSELPDWYKETNGKLWVKNGKLY